MTCYHRWAGVDALEAEGFKTPTNTKYGLSGEFISYKRGRVNVIFTTQLKFYENFVRTTKLAKALNLQKKKDRVTVFQAVIYGKFPK